MGRLRTLLLTPARALRNAVIASRRRSNPGGEALRSAGFPSAAPGLLRFARNDGEGVRRATAGFLLMETLATFTISAFVLLGLVSAASVLLRAVDGSVARIERVDDLGRAMDALRRDVAQISRARWNGIEPQPFVFRGGPNSLYFAHATRALDGSRVGEAVALREIVTASGPTLMRATARLPARATTFEDLAFGPQHEMWTGTARLRFAYVGPREHGAEPEPSQSWPVGLKLPAAILIEAVDRNTRRVLVSTRVTIEADADIGCLGDGAAAPTAAGASAASQSTQPDPATQGPGGIDFGAPSQVAALPAPNLQGAGAPQAAGDGGGAFCGRAEDGDDKPKPPAAVAGAIP